MLNESERWRRNNNSNNNKITRQASMESTVEINSNRTRLSVDRALQVQRTGYCDAIPKVKPVINWMLFFSSFWIHSAFLIRISAGVLRRLCHNFHWQRLIILNRYFRKWKNDSWIRYDCMCVIFFNQKKKLTIYWFLGYFVVSF